MRAEGYRPGIPKSQFKVKTLHFAANMTNNGAKRKYTDAVDEVTLARAKTVLCTQLNQSTSHFHTAEEEQRMKVSTDRPVPLATTTTDPLT